MSVMQKSLPPEGLWISDDGRWIPVVEHLATLAGHPEMFGLSRRDVAGASIDELRIVADGLIRLHGWTRFRSFSDGYNFEVDSARAKMRTVEDVLARIGALPHERIVISQATPRKDFEGTVGDVFDRVILRFQENAKRPNRWRFT